MSFIVNGSGSLFNAISAHLSAESYISNGSCSTHRSFGQICVISISCEHNSLKCGSDLKIFFFFYVSKEKNKIKF